MEDRIDNAAILVRRKLEEDGEWESSDQCPLVGLLNDRITKRGALNRQQRGLDTAEFGALLVVDLAHGVVHARRAATKQVFGNTVKLHRG